MVLIVGGTGYMGRRLARASLAHGYATYILQRPEIGLDIDKLQMLHDFKKQGARLIQGSFDDHRSLVEAVKQVDVVARAVSGVHFRSHNILMQLKLVEAIKEAGSVKRFLPSEFGTDPSRMGDSLEPGRESFDEKMEVRGAIEDAKIPFTYVSANCFAGYFVGNLCQLGRLTTPTDSAYLWGWQRQSCVLDEDDIATYAMKTVEDHRTLNKTVHLRPTENIVSQMELVNY